MKRIEFIDLAKGVCILLVVLGHAGLDIPIIGFNMMRMPLYFILSGLFFRDYGGFLQHTLKKVNKILIPFLFFYIVAYIPFYIFHYVAPRLIVSEAKGILDVFNNRQFFNGPIWFLLCLFWTNLLFCFIKLHIRREYLRGCVVFLLGVIGVLLGKESVFLPLFWDVSLTALPYFYMGYLLTKTSLLFPNKYDKYALFIAIICYGITYVICVCFDNPYMSFHYNRMHGNLILNYIGSFSCVIAILMLCKMIKSLPIVSYCGRYSIMLLCLHHLIYRPLQLFANKIHGGGSHWIIPMLTVAICIALIPACKRFIPWFTAQKDLIKTY